MMSLRNDEVDWCQFFAQNNDNITNGFDSSQIALLGFHDVGIRFISVMTTWYHNM